MPEYDLDKLGWQDFERLTQVLLKAEFGATVQDWSGYQDYGKDAYCSGDLKGRQGEFKGPVIFQAKFVHGANAAGAKYWPLIKNACEKEKRRISERIASSQWMKPSNYFLLSNCPLRPSEREDLTKMLSPVIDGLVSILGRQDVEDILDIHPQVARSYPQILSYAHLISLLDSPTSKAIATRSKAALAEAQSLLPIFAPTSAYQRAWEKLRKHHFVVLTGPPEMGKTAIGRMHCCPTNELATACN